MLRVVERGTRTAPGRSTWLLLDSAHSFRRGQGQAAEHVTCRASVARKAAQDASVQCIGRFGFGKVMLLFDGILVKGNITDEHYLEMVMLQSQI